MYISFDSPDPVSRNSSGPQKMINYLNKENDKKEDLSKNVGDGFFSREQEDLSKAEAISIIEHSKYRTRLESDQTKYYSLSINFSAAELLGKSDQDLIDYVKNEFSGAYSSAILGRDVDPNNIVWVAKLEKERRYKGDAQMVKDGIVKSGDLKPGDNRHVHILIARKTLCDKKVSPLSNHFREGVNNGVVKGGFDQDSFKMEIESRFDRSFGFKREYESSYQKHLDIKRPDLNRSLNYDSAMKSQLAQSANFFPIEKQKAFLSASLKRQLYKTSSLYELKTLLSEKGVQLNLARDSGDFIVGASALSTKVSNPKEFTLSDLGLDEKKFINRFQEKSLYVANSPGIKTKTIDPITISSSSELLIDGKPIQSEVDQTQNKKRFKRKTRNHSNNGQNT